jgi:hypothetical protein
MEDSKPLTRKVQEDCETSNKVKKESQEYLTLKGLLHMAQDDSLK